MSRPAKSLRAWPARRGVDEPTAPAPSNPSAAAFGSERWLLGALWGTAILGILSFAAIVLVTDVWRQEPLLSAGLTAALAVLPGIIAELTRAISSASGAGAAGEPDRRPTLRLIADNLGAPLATIGAALALGGRQASRRQPDEPALTGRAVRILASQINDIRDLAALGAGAFAPPVETFDLRAVVGRSLASLQATAADEGIALRWRVDPHLPVRLRGRAQALARILTSLAGHAIANAATATVRIAVAAASGDARRLWLRLVVETADTDQEPGHGDAEGSLDLHLLCRLVALMRGAFATERVAGGRARLTVTLPLAVEDGAGEPVLDLGRRPVLIATEDEAFAGALAAPFAAWNADVRWVGDPDDASAVLARDAREERPLMVPVLIIDGSRKLLSALSLAHRAARVGGPAPYVLLVADPGQIERLDEVDEGEVDGFIPLPLGDQLLANAVSALPLGQPMADRPRLPDPQRGSPGEFDVGITAKFIPEAGALDMRAIEGLRELSGDPDFLGELIASFQADAQQIIERLDHAVATSDAVGFGQNLTALRRAASALGATQLCDLLASLQGLSAGDLRQLGASHVRRLDAEVDRVAAALTEIVTRPEARLP